MIEYIDLIVAICGAITVIVPLCVKLYKTIKALIKEKNYAKIITAIYNLVVDAEILFDKGADKKAHVLNEIKELCIELNVEFDAEKFGLVIDTLIDVTKNVNKK